MLGEVAETGMEAVFAGTVGIPVDQDSLHIVVEDGPWRAADCVEQQLVRLDQRLKLLIVGKPDETEPAVAKRRNEG